ncbi:isocitrate lyase/phosphoenolpyruvate mutase family protein [Nocardia ninae]|uniref:isocitrate lyase/phosphoenolpyruvate mutase family protein n=1 Tax=Nocardia ninae TaxID=356145 RepID=UPI001FE47C05|nr:isocitrate lyase/phosphoenolpyruvate mutase family protein [Nocardia ninae]
MRENLPLHPSSAGGAAGVRLRRLLADPAPSFLMGAHDGLSARIAAEAGFAGIWASGLCMSTVLGARDSDEVSWGELLALAARVVESGAIPVLVDADTGYGNFNTARRVAARAEQIGAAGICMEDKVFPKMNSYFGDSHPLAPIGEMCTKIAACRDKVDAQFVLVARTEALIAGAGLAEALRRAEAYREAGADAIFIHSRQRTIDEIAEFTTEWGNRLPMVIAPTTYHETPQERYAELGIAAVIWANQAMRATVVAMRQVCRSLRLDGAAAVEPTIAALGEVFALMGYQDLETDEEHYIELAKKWVDS